MTHDIRCASLVIVATITSRHSYCSQLVVWEEVCVCVCVFKELHKVARGGLALCLFFVPQSIVCSVVVMIFCCYRRCQSQASEVCE